MVKGKATEKWDEIEDAGFWNPSEIGDELEGEVIEIDEGEYGIYVVIDSEEGETRTPSHKNLQSKLEKLDIGDYVKIVFSATKDVGRDEPMRMYRLFVRPS